jgi:hypothetical protein
MLNQPPPLLLSASPLLTNMLASSPAAAAAAAGGLLATMLPRSNHARPAPALKLLLNGKLCSTAWLQPHAACTCSSSSNTTIIAHFSLQIY